VSCMRMLGRCCTAHTVLRILYCANCNLLIVLCTLYCAHCILLSVRTKRIYCVCIPPHIAALHCAAHCAVCSTVCSALCSAVHACPAYIALPDRPPQASHVQWLSTVPVTEKCTLCTGNCSYSFQCASCFNPPLSIAATQETHWLFHGL
jgi:hypothetical protein